MPIIRGAGIAAASAAILAALTISPDSAQMTSRPSLFAKGQDMMPFEVGGVSSEGMIAAGVTVGDFRWIGCGVLDGYITGRSDLTACSSWGARAVPIFESEATLWQIARHGVLKGRTVLIDLEKWHFTPAGEQADLPRTISRAARLSHRDHFRLILSVGGGFNLLPVAEQLLADAAGDRVYAVSMQGQGYSSNLANWSGYAKAVVKAVRARSRTIAIMGGIATNTPAVHSASALASDYQAAGQDGLGSVWLNASNWSARNLCGAAQGGPDCPVIARQFMQLAGLPARLPPRG